MRNRYLRPFLIFEFLVALQVLFTVWSEVGGQYHLDLMFWPWKLGISFAGAALVVGITAQIARNDGAFTTRARIWCAMLALLFVLAGVVTYYYHFTEPTDQDQDSDEPAQTAQTSARRAL